MVETTDKGKNNRGFPSRNDNKKSPPLIAMLLQVTYQSKQEGLKPAP